MMCFYILLYFNPRSREGSDEKRLRETEEKYQFQSTLPRGERLSVFAPAQQPAYFNPRSREGSDAHHPSVFFHFTHFNPRSREGSDTTNQSVLHCFRKFQSTLPRGERPATSSFGFSRVIISIHAPARGATRVQHFAKVPSVEFQSTLPRGERPWAFCGEKCVFYISIHAPARGATSQTFSAYFYPDISIHAPARGATRCVSSDCSVYLISIHAPARGATMQRVQ